MKKLLPLLCCIGLCGCLGSTITYPSPQPLPEPQAAILQVQAVKQADLRLEEPNLFTRGPIGWPGVLIISGFMIVAPAAIIKMKGM